MMNDEPGNCEFRTANADPRFSCFDIRNSAFDIRPIRRILIKADRGMLNDELRMSNRAAFASSFEIQPSNSASFDIRISAFGISPVPVCVWSLAKNKAAVAKRGFRDRVLINFSNN